MAWISGFLLHQRQRVVCDGSTSHWSKVTSGVPQGFILGSLLFIIYINNIGSSLASHTRLFADDCTVFREISSHQDCVALQTDLDRLLIWSQKWQLSLSASKCKMMCISSKTETPQYTYLLNNVPLEWVNTYVYLRVKIHKKLNWGDHISGITHKATKILNILRRAMYTCSSNAKNRAYIALVRPHLEYCSPVWSPYSGTDGSSTMQ